LGQEIVRILGVDYGRRRVGLAVSDDSATLARPWMAIDAGPGPRVAIDRIVAAIDGAKREYLGDFDIAAVVVGLPRRLNGAETEMTAVTRKFATALAARLAVPLHLQDERLTSREAEAVLAAHEPDWRARKKQLDAMAAAILLQDYLDSPRDAAQDADGGDTRS
jgi:putative Holliday junction resolvase